MSPAPRNLQAVEYEGKTYISLDDLLVTLLEMTDETERRAKEEQGLSAIALQGLAEGVRWVSDRLASGQETVTGSTFVRHERRESGN